MTSISSFAGPDDPAVQKLIGAGQPVLVTIADRPRCSGVVITVLADDAGRPAMLVLDMGNEGVRGINWSHIVWVEPPGPVHPGLA